MVKAKVGDNMLILGLNEANMELIKEGKPLKAHFDDPDVILFVFCAKDDAELKTKIMEAFK